MQLYAAGSNQSLQLQFEKQEHMYPGDLDDLWEFTCVFRHRDIHTVRSFSFHTTGRWFRYPSVISVFNLCSLHNVI